MADVPDTDGRMWKVVLEKRYPVELANILHLTTDFTGLALPECKATY
ncbi:unnamed protein product [Penicillium roqueforti FM164]|uniref:Genomic scaffold, ProqFM164S02 n=1 Tax=Penicillium roqueforti (strain FM164) TaxID=1365484 RepID=W6Q4Y3_PENRF|nr:unnamed protein product [Penicillium roqueforti FM164]